MFMKFCFKSFLVIFGFILVLGLAGFFIAESVAASAQVTVRWDPNDPAPEGYRVFVRAGQGSYNYDEPAWDGTATTATIYDLLAPAPVPLVAPAGLVSSWSRKASEVSLTWEQPDPPAGDVGETYYFIVRAYVGDLESADSEEVSYTPTAWIPTVSMWKIFFRVAGNSEWTEFETIENTSSTERQISRPFTAVPDGQVESIEWVIVAYDGDGGFSPNSQISTVVIDRRPVETPQKPRIVEVTIPVQ